MFDCYNSVIFENNMSPYCLLLLLLVATHSQPCQPQFLIPSILQDTFDILSFQNNDLNSNAQYTYPFNQNYFGSQPIPLLSISGLNVQGLSSINYLLTSSFINNTLVISMKSNGMTWKKATIWMILHSRKDISQKITTLTTSPNLNSFLAVKASITAQNIAYFSNVLGIEASAASQYSFELQAMKIGGQNVNIMVTCNIKANLTIQTIFFDTAQKQFVYGYQKIPVTSLNQFYGVWMEFAPVIYSLIGFNTFSFAGNSIQLDLSLDLTSNYLFISRSPSFSSLELAFFSIGQLPSQVCTPCNNFIAVNGCQFTCPSNSYAYSFSNGGKTCRTCFQPLGQTLLSNECSCPNNQVYYQGNCYKTPNLPVNCSSNQILIGKTCYFKTTNKTCQPNSHTSPDQSKCICDDGYQFAQSQCLKLCPERSKRTSYGICACNYGYIMNSSKLCESVCPPNSIYRQDLDQCVCNYNYQKVDGKCSECPKGQFYNRATSSCVVALFSKAGVSNNLSLCQSNQIMVNGKCDCDSKSIRINGICTPCPQSTYKSNSSCESCNKYCNQCESSAKCTQCQAGFNIKTQKCQEICGDGRRFVLECDDGNNQNGDGCSSDCKLQQGYVCAGGSSISTDTCQKVDSSIKDLSISLASPPRYESAGIIVPFRVNPPVSRTSKQLYNIFRFVFSNGASPKGIILNQNDNDPSEISAFFDYKNSLVNAQFKVLVTVEQNPYGSARLDLSLDTLQNPTTSALDLNNNRKRRGNMLD